MFKYSGLLSFRNNSRKRVANLPSRSDSTSSFAIQICTLETKKNLICFPSSNKKQSVHFSFLHLPDKPKKSNTDLKKFPVENFPLIVNENSNSLIQFSVDIKHPLLDSPRTQQRKTDFIVHNAPE